MSLWVYAIFFVMIVIILVLCGVIVSMRCSLREISDQFERRLSEGSNTPIFVSSSDREVRRFASRINQELKTLRAEQLKAETGSHELQNAITNVAHDLRTPLTAISGYLELLEEQKLDERSRGYTAVISERTATLRSLTEELFAFSVTDNAANELKYEDVVINKELEIALAASYSVLSDAGITPDIRISDKPVVRSLDKKALQRIFGNILNNAAKYSSGGLTVSLESDGSIVFSNRSETMSEIDAGRLFDRFYTVENAKGSTGLGLSIAKLLTEKMGGRISAELAKGVFSIRVFF